ncbi:hypothetical protein B484DRAFT_464546 [Ochromonadaceae sp. CCMP2298]|nr:hypothetical protein B484DRAFT_464546 [Ochromonadaceae sp. CCMP2298]
MTVEVEEERVPAVVMPAITPQPVGLSAITQHLTDLVVSKQTHPCTATDTELDEVPAIKKKAKPSPIKLLELKFSWERIQECWELLQTKGSHQYSKVEKLLAVRAVMTLLLDWRLEAFDILEMMDAGGDEEEGGPASSLLSPSVPGKEQVPTMSKACTVVSERLCITYRLVAAWVYEYYSLGKISDAPSRRRQTLISDNGQLGPEHILELVTFLCAQRKQGRRTTYRVLQTHVLSDVRLNEHCSTVPSALVSIGVIRDAMRKTGVLGWSRILRVGKKADDPEKEERRRWRIRVFWVHYARYSLLERSGKVVMNFQDESFINLYHGQNHSLCLVDDTGKLDVTMEAPAGPGPRLCINGVISRYGHMIPKDKDGDAYVIDCKYANAAGEEVHRGGHFVELDNHGNVRATFKAPVREKAPPRLDSLTVPVLKEKMVALGIDEAALLLSVGVKKLLKAHIVAAIKGKLGELDAAAAAATAVAAGPFTGGQVPVVPATVPASAFVEPVALIRGKDFSADQIVNFDFDQYDRELADMAHTTDKIFEANKHRGDYHDNYDTVMFYKCMFAQMLAYPSWCKDMQRASDSGELETGGWYDWERDRPLRSLITFIDNAPYHLGAAVQLGGKSKGAIAELLRKKGVGRISFQHVDKDGVTGLASCEVPAEGKSFDRGFPSADQVKEGACAALKELDPLALEAPWNRLLQRVKHHWGPEDIDGWIVVRNAQYTSPQIPVELKWADGKNFVANPCNDTFNRTMGDIIKLLRLRWYYGPTTGLSLFCHCEKIMTELIKYDNEVCDGPLSGEMPYGLQGLPNDATLKEWEKRAGEFMEESESEFHGSAEEGGEGGGPGEEV